MLHLLLKIVKVYWRAENQSVEMLLISNQGEWKEDPEAGCDIVSAQHGTSKREDTFL